MTSSLHFFNYLKLQLAEKSTTLLTESKRRILKAEREGDCSDVSLIRPLAQEMSAPLAPVSSD